MKKSFAYFSLALALSLLLSGCGDMTDHGNVGVSPMPAVTEPVLPMPSLEPEISPTPDSFADNGMQREDAARDDNARPEADATDSGSTAAVSPSPAVSGN